MMKKVILTGATGFIGANLARCLLEKGQEVHLFLRESSATWRIQAIANQVTIHTVNLSDAEALKSTVQSIQPDWIFHLATEGAYSWQNDLNRIVTTNIQGTINLLTACQASGFDAFINTGSSSEYGFKDHAAAEDDLLEPNSTYAVSKASATLFCRYIAIRDRLNVTTLRLYSVYGPFEDPRRLIPTLILKGSRGQYPPLVNPDIARDFVFVDDVCAAYIRAAEVPGSEFGRIFNVGSGIQTSIREIVEVVRKQFQIRDDPQWGSMEKRSWDTSSWVGDCRKITQELGWRPAFGLAEGFSKTAAWFIENRSILP